MIVRQVKVGPWGVFAYLIGCEATSQALALDPGAEAERIASEAKRAGLQIGLIAFTHSHPDHTAAGSRLAELTGARVIGLDDPLVRVERQIGVGSLALAVIPTPGHTVDGVCYYAEGQLFTGDTLFVGDSGRTDLAGGHRPTLGASIRRLMDSLPADTVVWPGHDYGPTPSSTLAWERVHNVNAREYGFFRPGV